MKKTSLQYEMNQVHNWNRQFASTGLDPKTATLFRPRCGMRYVFCRNKAEKVVIVMHHNKARLQGRFAPGPLYSGPSLKRYAYEI